MKKKIIWMVIAIIIIIAATLGILYYTTDLFKTPEQLFYIHFDKNFGMLGKTDYEDAMAKLKEQSEASTEVSGEITAKMSTNDPSAKEIEDVISKGKIVYNTKAIGSEQKMQSDITLNYDNKDIVTLNLLQNKEQYGIKIKEAYDKYISVENNNLKALFQKLGADVTNVPDKIQTIDCYEFFNIDKETLKHIEETYSNIMKDNISEESYSVEKNVIVKIDGVGVKTNAYKLTLTEEQVKTICIKLLETLKGDNKTLDLLVEKTNKITEGYEELTTTKKVTKEELVKSLETAIKDFNEMTATDKTAMEIVSYGIKDNKTKIEIRAFENEMTIANLEMNIVKANGDTKFTFDGTIEDMTINAETIYNNEKTDISVSVTEEGTKVDVKMSAEKDGLENITIKAETNGTIIEANVKQNVKFVEKPTIDEFTTENSVKLNDMTTTEMQQLVQTIYANVMKSLPEKMQLLGITTTPSVSL